MHPLPVSPVPSQRGEQTTDGSVLALIVRFQGLCTFLRNRQDPSQADEVVTVMVAAEDADQNPPLCKHTPVLVFKAADFHATVGTPSHYTALYPLSDPTEGADLPPCDATPRSPQKALGIWPLQGRDLHIVGARPHDLTICPDFNAADIDKLTAQGAASRDCLVSPPPPGRLVASRFLLTSGSLTQSANIGSAAADDQWVFEPYTTDPADNPTTGLPVSFAQEVEYRYYIANDPSILTIDLESRRFGDSLGPAEILQLATTNLPVTIGVSCLCATDLKQIDQEVDFLAYYSLLDSPTDQKVIPKRIKRPNLETRVLTSACPPATTYLKEAAS